MHSKPYSALIHSCRTLLRRPCAPVLLSLALAVAGCTSASFDTADQRHEDALKRVGEARNALLQPQAAPAYAVEDQRPVIARRSIALSRDAALPDAFRLVTFRFPGRYTLPNVAERISREVGIPIVITSDALMPASMFSIATGGQAGAGAMGPGGMLPGAAAGLNGTPNVPGAAGAATAGAGSAPPSFASQRLSDLSVPSAGYTDTFELNYSGPLAGLLDDLVARAALQWRYEDGRIILYRVSTRSFLIKALPTPVKLSGTLSVSAGGSSSGGSSGSGGSSAASGTMDFESDFWAGLDMTLRKLVSMGGKLTVDTKTGIVTLTDGAEAMAAVASYIDLINQSMMRQISLDIEVLEVDLNDDYSAGINWGMLQNGVQTGITQGNVSITAAPNLQANGTPFSVGYVGNDGRNVLLSVLRNFGRVSTAYSGVAVTSNRVSVPILVQNTQAYLMQTQSTITATAVAGATSTGPSLVPGQISTGLSVVLQPIILDSNQVLVQAFLNISSLKQLQSFSSAGQTIQLPNIDGFTVAQRLVVPSGKTMVMLGYDQASANNNENGPADNVTTSKTVANVRRSIVILITPRLTDV